MLSICGAGGVTSILTDYFEKLLFSIGRQKVYKIDSSRIGEHILRDLHSEALLILISTTGDFPPTAKLARLARMNNIPVLSITPYRQQYHCGIWHHKLSIFYQSA